MIIVFTGNGKGKTTAALGQAVRAIGDGKRVLMVQFIKGPWKSGEDFFLEKFNIPHSAFNIIKTGKGFVGILGDSLPIEEHKRAAEEGLALARGEIESGKWDIVILDEINNAVSLNLISREEVLGFIQVLSSKLQALVLTGRDAPQEFIDLADLVTEMRDIKHPFEGGVMAKRGIEY
ncbi:MAG: cob(I)yrinic acid a,c-diamide adenosyltransferase [Candidatus Sungbacteria bacterium]|nr:cob(I)yrinic acid a,c-diamide adenosyltransferase [Candidatus Sungbacteria bacterium]